MTTIPMTEELAKILVRHVDDDREYVETPWAKRVGANLYQLDNLLWCAYGISCEDEAGGVLLHAR